MGRYGMARLLYPLALWALLAVALGGHLYTDDAECADDSDCPTGRFCDIRDLGYGTPGICVLTDYCTDVSPEAVGGTGAYGYVSGWNVDSDFEFSYELDYYVLPEDQADGCVDGDALGRLCHGVGILVRRPTVHLGHLREPEP